MDSQPPPTSSSSFELGDIYYTLFRHKWRILLCAAAGLGATFAAYKLFPPPFQSQAKLFVRYVITEGKSLGPGRDDAVTKSPDQRGETIMNSEIEILTSLDLAEEVAKNVGPEKILAKTDGGRSIAAAAVSVRNGLSVDVARNSSVISISFRHPDSEIVQIVLREVVANYLKKHTEIHRAVGIVGDFLTQETDQLRSRLAQTEEELRKATNKAGIISLEDYKKTTSEQLSRLRQQIFDVQAELAERISIYEQMTKTQAGATPAATTATEPPPEKIEAYVKVATLVGQLRQREQEVLAQFTPESQRVQVVRTQLADAERQKAELEAAFPALARQAPQPTAPGSGTQYDPIAEAARISALQTRLKVLTTQVDEIRSEAGKVDQLEITIMELRRRKELEETNYRYYAASLEQSRINEALGTGRVSNISQIQTPTPPFKDWKKMYQILAGIAGSGFVIGLGWAFLIELYLDRSIRRPNDVERALQLPLFLSIPKTKARKAKKQRARKKSADEAHGGAWPAGDQLTVVPPETGDPRMPALNPFHETLRDRLISYFDSLNLRHKPKLIAVTGLGRNSGVTTMAAGLARSFSETGEGNVLLVDMTQGKGAAQQFHKGTPIGLEQLFDTRGSAFVRNHLYVVTESSSSERLAKGMPQRFNQLIPKLKASDFEYIIFDMPPVNQISITPRLAQFMDLMLMVAESEKTDRDLAARASALLAKAGTPVGVVLNKAKTYIPAWLHKDHEFLIGG